MPPLTGFTTRLFRAHLRLQERLGEKVSQQAFGDLVAEALGRRSPYRQGTVADWFSVGVRDAEVIWGMAEVCGVRPAWLAWGELPATKGGSSTLESDITLDPPHHDEALEADLNAEAESRPAKKKRPAAREAADAKRRKPGQAG